VGLFGGPGEGVLPGRAALKGGRRSSGTPSKAIDATAPASPSTQRQTFSVCCLLFAVIDHLVGPFQQRPDRILIPAPDELGLQRAHQRLVRQRPWRAKGGVKTFSRHPQRQTPPIVTISANGSDDIHYDSQDFHPFDCPHRPDQTMVKTCAVEAKAGFVKVMVESPCCQHEVRDVEVSATPGERQCSDCLKESSLPISVPARTGIHPLSRQHRHIATLPSG